MTARPPARRPRVHEQRDAAEGFGADAARYDRARPGYPRALVARIVGGSPGSDLLDVGCGTGIASRLFQAAGCRVLGLDVDPRMAELARSNGVEIEIGTIEEWDPAGRRFDIVTAAQTWHWVDPVVGAAKVADVLRPGGRVALFWNAADVPLDLRRRFAEVYERVVPDFPMGSYYRRTDSAGDAYQAFLDTAADGMARTNAFGEPERWRDDWRRIYTREEWLDVVPTQGGHHLIADRQDELLDGLGAAIDDMGGEFTMTYATVTVTAVRR